LLFFEQKIVETLKSAPEKDTKRFLEVFGGAIQWWSLGEGLKFWGFEWGLEVVEVEVELKRLIEDWTQRIQDELDQKRL
jgi:hypothetical protein